MAISKESAENKEKIHKNSKGHYRRLGSTLKCWLTIQTLVDSLENILFYFFAYFYFLALPLLFFAFVTVKDVEMMKKMILTSKCCAKHPFTGRNTKQQSIEHVLFTKPHQSSSSLRSRLLPNFVNFK